MTKILQEKKTQKYHFGNLKIYFDYFEQFTYVTKQFIRLVTLMRVVNIFRTPSVDSKLEMNGFSQIILIEHFRTKSYLNLGIHMVILFGHWEKVRFFCKEIYIVCLLGKM